MNKLLKNIFKLYKEAQVVKKAETIEQQINDNKYSIDTENSDNNKLLGTANDLVFAYDVISKAMDMAENQKEDEFAVYTLSPDKDKIVNMKYIKKDDVYNYKPNQNEYGLVRVRDTGFIDTDYQLQPMIMIAHSWNEHRKFYSSKKKNVVKKAKYDETVQGDEIVKDCAKSFGYDIKVAGDFGKYIYFYLMDKDGNLIRDKKEYEKVYDEMKKRIDDDIAIQDFAISEGLIERVDNKLTRVPAIVVSEFTMLRSKRFDELNSIDAHFHGQSEKDGSLTFICYEYQDKNLDRTVLQEDDKVLIFAYSEPFNKKELQMIVKPKEKISDEEITNYVKQAKKELDKIVENKDIKSSKKIKLSKKAWTELEKKQVGAIEENKDKYKIYQNMGGEIIVTNHKLNDKYALMDSANTIEEIEDKIATDWEDHANAVLWDSALKGEVWFMEESEDGENGIVDMSSDYAEETKEAAKRDYTAQLNQVKGIMKEYGYGLTDNGFIYLLKKEEPKDEGFQVKFKGDRLRVELDGKLRYSGFGPQAIEEFLQKAFYAKKQSSKAKTMRKRAFKKLCLKRAMHKTAGEWKLLKLIAEEMEEYNKLNGSVPITDYAVYWNIEVYNDMKYLDISKLSKKAQSAILDEIETALKGGYSKGEIQVQEEFIDESDKKILNEDLLLEFFLNLEDEDLNLDDVEIDLGNEDLPDSFGNFRQLAKRNNKLQKKATKTLEEVAGLIDTILDDFDHYDYADQLEVGETSLYENILAYVQKDEKGTIESLFNRIKEDDGDEAFTSKELDQLKEYYNSKFGKTATTKQAENKVYIAKLYDKDGVKYDNIGKSENIDELKDLLRDWLFEKRKYRETNSKNNKFYLQDKIVIEDSNTGEPIETIKVSDLLSTYGRDYWKPFMETKATNKQASLKYYAISESGSNFGSNDNKDELKEEIREFVVEHKDNFEKKEKIYLKESNTNKTIEEIKVNEIVTPYGSKKWVIVATKKTATIKHENGVYNVYSESGKCLGKGYKTKEEAEKRLKQVEYFKHKKAKWAEETGTDFYGQIYIPNEDEGTFRIKYYGGPGHIEYLRKSKNGKYHWVDQTHFNYQDDKPFETTDYELVKRLVDQFGGKPEKIGTNQTNNKKKSLKQIVISKMAKIKK